MANVYSARGRQKEISIVDELLDILPYDSPAALELHLRVLSTLPVEVRHIYAEFLFSICNIIIIITLQLFVQYEKKYEAKSAKLREAITDLINSWCQTAWFLQRVFSLCNPESESKDSTLFTLGLECAQSWLKIGQLPLQITGQIYPYLLMAASYYAPNRYVGCGNLLKECSRTLAKLTVRYAELSNTPLTFSIKEKAMTMRMSGTGR